MLYHEAHGTLSTSHAFSGSSLLQISQMAASQAPALQTWNLRLRKAELPKVTQW